MMTMTRTGSCIAARPEFKDMKLRAAEQPWCDWDGKTKLLAIFPTVGT